MHSSLNSSTNRATATATAIAAAIAAAVSNDYKNKAAPITITITIATNRQNANFRYNSRPGPHAQYKQHEMKMALLCTSILRRQKSLLTVKSPPPPIWRSTHPMACGDRLCYPSVTSTISPNQQACKLGIFLLGAM